MIEPARLLVSNALLQITFSAWFGGWLLYRMHGAGRRNGARDLVAAHLDWIMLGLVQIAVSRAIEVLDLEGALTPATMIVAAGWLNPVPYLARGLGVDGFTYGGARVQRTVAVLGGASVLLMTTGLTWITIASLG